MTPKEKAEELVFKFRVHTIDWPSMNYHAKKCALIAVDEILSNDKESLEVAEGLHPHAQGLIAGSIKYWHDVKQEIEKL